MHLLHVLYFNLQVTSRSVTGLVCIAVSNLYIFIVIYRTLCFVPVSFNLNKHLKCHEDHDVAPSEIPPLQHPLN